MYEYDDSNAYTQTPFSKCNKIHRFSFVAQLNSIRIIMSKAFVLRANALNLRSICLKNTNGSSTIAIQLFGIYINVCVCITHVICEKRTRQRVKLEEKEYNHLRAADFEMPST